MKSMKTKHVSVNTASAGQKKVKLKRHRWIKKEDKILRTIFRRNKLKNWTYKANILSQRIGKHFKSKQCWDHWNNVLDPNIRNDKWIEEEIEKFIELHKKHGNKWCKILKEFKGRTYDNIKNFFNSNIRKLCTDIHKCEFRASNPNEIERTLYFLSYISKYYTPHQKNPKEALETNILLKKINSIPLSSFKNYIQKLWSLYPTLCQGTLRDRLMDILKDLDLIDSFDVSLIRNSDVAPRFSTSLTQHRNCK